MIEPLLRNYFSQFYEKILSLLLFNGTHMESLNHCLLTRDELKEDLKVKELSSTIIVPNDGETLYNL